MDHPLPELYPIVVPPLYSRPFECFGEGLRYRGPQGLRYARESLANIKALLSSEKDEDEQQPQQLEAVTRNRRFKKFKKPIKSPDPRTGIFWNAQLRLYGIESQPSRPDVLRKLFKDALQNGLRSPPHRLLELEAQLNRQFVLENAQERDKQYEALTDHDTDEKILLYPKRFFREFFADGTNSLFTIPKRFPHEVQDAAEAMGSHFGSATNIDGEFWTIVGREALLVSEHLKRIEIEKKDSGRNGKRQKTAIGEDTVTEKGRQQQTVAVEEDITAAAADKGKHQQQEDVVENDQESFRKMDVTQMDRLWRTLDDDRKLELYPTRFLSEHFFSEGKEKFVQAFKDDNTDCTLNRPDKKRHREIRAAAELLGLRVAIAENLSVELSERWTVIGRDQAAVEKRKQEIDTLQYEALDETEKFELFPKRFLLEHLLENGNEAKDRVVIFKIETLPLPVLPDALKIEEVLLQHAKNGNEKIVTLKTPPGNKLIDAVKSLGLLMDADIIGLRWVLVGRNDCEFVQKCAKKISDERDKPEKQRVEEQVEAIRKEIEEADVGTSLLPFDDVKGEWNIECDGVEWYLDDSDGCYDSDGEIYEQIQENENGVKLNCAAYEGASKKMSIFFHTVVRKDDGQLRLSTTELSERAEDGTITEKAPRLCANFFLGLFGGLLRSEAPAPQFLSFPSDEIRFTFKGWDEAAGTPFDETLGPRCGSLSFHSRCLFKGVIKSTYGTMKIVGRKMSHKPNVECYDWEDLHPAGDDPLDL